MLAPDQSMAAASRPTERFLAALAAPDRQPITDLVVAVIVAHPDDETIGIGAQLPRLLTALVVVATDGAPRDESDARAHGFSGWQDYAAARDRELAAAMAEAGVGGERVLRLGVPDKEAAFHLVALPRLFAKFLRTHRTDIVVTHPYEGGHPDHDAIAFGVHAAAALLARDRLPPPGIVEMASYYLAAEGLVRQRFASEPAAPETILPLAGDALGGKRRMLAAHASQADVLASFTAREERFRAAPAYDFTRPANGGRVDYARVTPEMSGDGWCGLARNALAELGLR